MGNRGRAVRLIDANEVVADLTAMKEHFDAIAIDGMIRRIERQATIDAVPVVRCENCRYARKLSIAELRIFTSDCMICENKHGPGVSYPEYNDVHGRVVWRCMYCSFGKATEVECKND